MNSYGNKIISCQAKSKQDKMLIIDINVQEQNQDHYLGCAKPNSSSYIHQIPQLLVKKR